MVSARSRNRVRLVSWIERAYDRHYRYFCGLLAVLFVVTFCVNSLNFVLEESNAGFSVDAQQWTLFAERAGACTFFFGLGGPTQSVLRFW